MKKKRKIKTQYVKPLHLLIFLSTVFYFPFFTHIFLLYHAKEWKDLRSNLYYYYILLQTYS